MARHRIAVIPGDGIGKEVMPEGLRVLEAAGRKFDIQWKFDEFDWSCDYYEKHGTMMPEDALERPQEARLRLLRRRGLARHGPRPHLAVGSR